MATLSLKLRGVKGGEPKWIDKMGSVNCFIDYSDYQKIYIDSFQGAGDSYKRREESLITIIKDQELIFEGTFTELVEKLSK